MSERTLVPIFVFWAFLTIITPTLILLSENSKADFDINGTITDRTNKARRMMGKPENDVIRFRTKAQEATLRIVAAEEIMAPSPAPNSSLSSYSYHDQRNNTDKGLQLLSPKTHVQQTGIRSTST